MAEKDKREGKGVPGVLLLGGAAAAAAVVLYFATRAKAAGLAKLYGKVTDAETGDPISGVLVSLTGSISLNVWTTLTDSGGNYVFADLEPGSYGVTYEKGGYNTAMSDIILVEGNNPLNVQLVPIAAPVASLNGVVTDAETGYALQGAKVTVDSLVAYTDSSGYYSFTGLSVGAHTVTFEKDDYETAVR